MGKVFVERRTYDDDNDDADDDEDDGVERWRKVRIPNVCTLVFFLTPWFPDMEIRDKYLDSEDILILNIDYTRSDSPIEIILYLSFIFIYDNVVYCPSQML